MEYFVVVDGTSDLSLSKRTQFIVALIPRYCSRDNNLGLLAGFSLFLSV